MPPLLWLRQPRHPYETLPTFGRTSFRLIDCFRSVTIGQNSSELRSTSNNWYNDWYYENKQKDYLLCMRSYLHNKIAQRHLGHSEWW